MTMGFADDLKKYCEKTKADVNTVVRKTALQLQTSVVALSPVDTGRFRANWVCSVGGLSKITTTVTDKTGELSIARVEAALQTWEPGQTIYLTNSLPYAARLEYDAWSKQAPAGMVRLTVQNFAEFLKRAVQEVK